MSWSAQKLEATPTRIHDFLCQHNAQLAQEQDTLTLAARLADSDYYCIHAGETAVGHMFIGKTGAVEFYLVSKYYSRDRVFGPKLREALSGVIADSIVLHTRLFSEVPISRPRTRKALKALGFVAGGKRRQAYDSLSNGREDTWVLDLLAEDLQQES